MYDVMLEIMPYSFGMLMHELSTQVPLCECVKIMKSDAELFLLHDEF